MRADDLAAWVAPAGALAQPGRARARLAQRDRVALGDAPQGLERAPLAAQRLGRERQRVQAGPLAEDALERRPPRLAVGQAAGQRAAPLEGDLQRGLELVQRARRVARAQALLAQDAPRLGARRRPHRGQALAVLEQRAHLEAATLLERELRQREQRHLARRAHGRGLEVLARAGAVAQAQQRGADAQVPLGAVARVRVVGRRVALEERQRLLGVVLGQEPPGPVARQRPARVGSAEARQLGQQAVLGRRVAGLARELHQPAQGVLAPVVALDRARQQVDLLEARASRHAPVRGQVQARAEPQGLELRREHARAAVDLERAPDLVRRVRGALDVVVGARAGQALDLEPRRQRQRARRRHVVGLRRDRVGQRAQLLQHALALARPVLPGEPLAPGALHGAEELDEARLGLEPAHARRLVERQVVARHVARVAAVALRAQRRGRALERRARLDVALAHRAEGLEERRGPARAVLRRQPSERRQRDAPPEERHAARIRQRLGGRARKASRSGDAGSVRAQARASAW